LVARTAAVRGIGLYQRFVSPYKGFRCAHHARTGGMTCSNYGRDAFEQFGFFEALSLLRARLVACAQAAQQGDGDADEGPRPMSEDEKQACTHCAACTFGNLLIPFFLPS
jgi:putative component of membrane protein insertase Oxa1/YidC/SpoIIIJ protein YidD